MPFDMLPVDVAFSCKTIVGAESAHGHADSSEKPALQINGNPGLTRTRIPASCSDKPPLNAWRSRKPST